jgi:GNAT superfamily N-acetyltransferase
MLNGTGDGSYEIRQLDGGAVQDAIVGLAEVLIDCVEGGASVGFLQPLSLARAESFWSEVADAVGRGETALWVGMSGKLVTGTVQLRLKTMENQPHRAEIAKLLVRRSGRRAGMGAALMEAAEDGARTLGRTTLVLDTTTSDAERLYLRRGWQLAGTIPGYALYPDGTLCHTSFYWKHLA